MPAFLVGGVALGLFGSAAWAPRALEQAGVLGSQNQLPQALRLLEDAGKVNAWDSRVTEARADLLERLYLATTDQVWKDQADEVYERALDLERVDGSLAMRNAERLTRRLDLDPSPEAFGKARFDGWDRAHALLPWNAFEDFDEGLFFVKKGDKDGAEMEFRTATQHEPNFAEAWFRLGLLFKEGKKAAEARICFDSAWGIHERWKNAERIDPVEKELVSLTPEELAFLKKELKK